METHISLLKALNQYFTDCFEILYRRYNSNFVSQRTVYFIWVLKLYYYF